MGVEHGKSYFSVEGDIICVKAVGAFNTEGIVRTIQELESLVQGFAQNEFKLLFDYTETEGGIPEVFDKINECNVWLNNQKMVAKAIVINSPTNLAILEKRSPARSLQLTKSFDNKSSAINWLSEQA